MNGKGPRKKKSKKKGAKKAPAGGLLARLFRKDAKAGTAADSKSAKAAPGKARPLTPLERSIQEIKHMTKVGQSDPERLAMMLSKLLQQEKQKQESAQESFDAMVWDIVHKAEAGDDEDAAEEGPAADAEGTDPEAPDPPGEDGPAPR